MDKFSFFPKEKLSLLPNTFGVYAFKNKHLLYIGKASDIKKRAKSHFQQPSYRDNLFISKVEEIGYIETDSEIEALILEAELINKYQPKYNVLWKDDKNYFYVRISKDNLPVVSITHQKNKKGEYIGPFIEGKPLKKSLKTLRKIFPYYSKKNHPPKPCSFCHLNLCPGPNPDIKEYKKNIKNLKDFLRGKKKAVIKNLKKEMEEASQKENYEKAAETRDKIEALERVISHAKVIRPKREIEYKKIEKELKKIFKKKIKKVEAYDISNIQGQKATGSMIVFIKGKPSKNLYRRFKIKAEGKPNDTAMIKEMLKRRFKHKEWGYPDLILIDGGKGQLNAALSETPKKIPVSALAKKENKLFIENKKEPLLLKDLPKELSNMILYLRDEAHRFAITYHRKLRKIDFV